MSIKAMGYLDFFGTKCVFAQDEMRYILMPVDEKSDIRDHFMDSNYRIEFSSQTAPYSIVSVKKQIGSDIKSVCLELNYIYKGHSNNLISGFIMVGNEIDQFFSPLEYYYRLKRKNKYVHTDLLYGREIIANYDFVCEGKKVDIELAYGDILQNGIRSDLSFHSELIVTFEETKDIDFVFQISH